MIPSRQRAERIVLLACAAALAAACGGAETESTDGCRSPDASGLPYDKLSDYCFFEGEMKDLEPADGAFAFEVAAPLWSDHAAKQRLIVPPKGEPVGFEEGEDWQFPEGTTLVKTFSFLDDFRDPDSARRIVETRLLTLGTEGWTGQVYLWNEAQTDADRIVAGERVPISYTDEDGVTFDEDYLVPNENQCKSCHERDDTVFPLGPTTPQLNRPVMVAGAEENQLEHLVEQGLFDGAIPPVESLAAFADPFGDAALDDRARAYLHANCSHCHRPGAAAGPTGLVLLAWEQEPTKTGICKPPVAAGPGTGGHAYDIVPGHPEQSILSYRISSTDPEIKMPELPNRVVDEKGVKLVNDWIFAMDPQPCE